MELAFGQTRTLCGRSFKHRPCALNAFATSPDKLEGGEHMKSKSFVEGRNQVGVRMRAPLSRVYESLQRCAAIADSPHVLTIENSRELRRVLAEAVEGAHRLCVIARDLRRQAEDAA